MVKKDLEKGLSLTKEDYAYGILKSIIAATPYVGGSAVEIFSLLCQAPISKRRDEFLILLGRDIVELKETIKDFNVDTLPENKMFITALMHALPIAMKNHQKEKLKALRNAVLNSALPNNIEDDIQLTFFNYIDSFSTLHLKLIKFFNEKKSDEWINELAKTFDHHSHMADSNGDYIADNFDGESYEVMVFALWQVLGFEFDDYKGEKYIFYEMVLNDLKTKNMYINRSGDIYYSLNHELTTKPNPMSKLFMEFITSPLNDDKKRIK